MSQPTTFWLVRHGLTEADEGRCYGRHDVCLSVEGMRQAGEIARRLANEPLTRVYSSPLRRAADTAQILAEPHRLNVETLDGLAEIHFGDFEGLTYRQIETDYPELFQLWMQRPAEIRFPNGEDFPEMRARVLRTLDFLKTGHRGQCVALVAHAGVIRVLLAEALSIPAHAMFRLGQRHAAINRIDYFEEGPVVQLVNG